MIRKLAVASLFTCAAAGAHAQAVCTRAELIAATDSYVAAQGNGDAAKMSFAEDAQYLENMIKIDPDAGLWNTALPIALSRSIHDSTRCKTFTEVVVTEGDHQYVVGTRLYVDGGKITRIDSLVSDKGDWLFNANAYLKFSSAENWNAPTAAEHTPAMALINGANNYLDLFSDKFEDIPWGIPCARLEGGAYTNSDNKADASCEIGIPAGVLYIVNRDYIVDETLGVINVFCRFGNSETGMPDSHTFKMINSKLRYVHTISVNLNPAAPSPQADDNGAIIR
ncbi:MAG: hypothetical protein V4628_14770 [Pseudomonadota bacterium]